MAQDDDEAWRAIVDNYGERPDLEPDVIDQVDDPETIEETDGPDRPEIRYADPEPQPPAPSATYEMPAPAGWDEESIDADWSTDRFVPPPPPSVPVATVDRMLAWVGVFGSPAVLLVFLVAGVSLPELLAYLLVIAFVGGFLYLVIQMPREPRDPYDDGAVL